jgi:hypothetical protein
MVKTADELTDRVVTPSSECLQMATSTTRKLSPFALTAMVVGHMVKADVSSSPVVRERDSFAVRAPQLSGVSV